MTIILIDTIKFEQELNKCDLTDVQLGFVLHLLSKSKVTYVECDGHFQKEQEDTK